jgi:hypothetical protein
MPLSDRERDWISEQVDAAPPFAPEQRRRLSRLMWEGR